jgi:hypothetical protein
MDVSSIFYTISRHLNIHNPPLVYIRQKKKIAAKIAKGPLSFVVSVSRILPTLDHFRILYIHAFDIYMTNISASSTYARG